jgi:hypothetical protein
VIYTLEINKTYGFEYFVLKSIFLKTMNYDLRYILFLLLLGNLRGLDKDSIHSFLRLCLDDLGGLGGVW